VNQRTSVEARESAIKMEQMTSRMEDIALKTEEETVSMRIVTYVTLVFLPGTFVSVRKHIIITLRSTRSTPCVSTASPLILAGQPPEVTR
jgi:hypothetical protein